MESPLDDPMRRTFQIAREAMEKGNHPFGALLLSPDGAILFEAENTVLSDHDITAHAEMNLIREASRELSLRELAVCTLYASTEPCPMCTGALYWAGIRKLVFGLSQTRLSELTHQGEESGAVFSCRDILRKGSRETDVTGPILENEALSVHGEFWVEPEYRGDTDINE